jgi:predicted RNA-binding Zn-ribbon protein involved in translation (DUF1610 family)
MAISFKCPQCGKKLKAPDSAAGKQSPCPGCGHLVTCPEAVMDAEVVEVTMEPVEDEFDPYGIAEEETAGPVLSRTGTATAAEARRPCPMCGEMILASAAKCRFCGEVFDATIAKVKKKGGKKRTLRKIAMLQKYLIMCILGMLGSYVALIVVVIASGQTAGGQAPHGPVLVVVGIVYLLLLVASIAAWILSVMLALNVYGTTGAVLLFLSQCIPCVSLIALLVVNGKATTMLRDSGVDVGFLGADLSQF